MPKAYQDNKIHPIRIIRNWLHQGLTYMDKGERGVRLTVEFVQFIVVFLMIRSFGDEDSDHVLFHAVLAGIIVHAWNWITNSNFWALMLFTIPDLSNRGEAATKSYLDRLGKRVGRSSSIEAVFLIGSAARQEWHSRSDIDIRFLRKPGFQALIGAWTVLTVERFRALLARQPLDLFLLDKWPREENQRFSEHPVCLFGELPDV
jgi:predicted nucleotidyltransferase